MSENIDAMAPVRRLGASTLPTLCQRCRNEFAPYRAAHVYCSRECRSAAWNETHRVVKIPARNRVINKPKWVIEATHCLIKLLEDASNESQGAS